jgi:hypothetical protein
MSAPHLPRTLEAWHFFEESTLTLFCSDLFHHRGARSRWRENPSWTYTGIFEITADTAGIWR